MRIIPINEAIPGMILAKTIYREENGQVLLQAKTVLKPRYILQIKKLNHEFIYIEDSGQIEDQPLPPEPIQAETKLKAISILKDTANKLQRNEKIDISQLKNIVLEMIEQILAKPEIIYNLNQINSYDNYTYSHSVNVSVLSIMTGALMGFNRKNLENLGIGALMHDIGKTLIDEKILNKPSRLEPQEFEVIKSHTRNGYEILKSRFPQSFLPAHIALQHHERLDGSGYPKGLSGDNIHQFAKIVAVADVFDAITSNRVYMKARPSYVGIGEIVNNINTKYDLSVVNHFTRIIAPYPVGSILTFDNGDKAIVTHVSRNECWIRFLSGSCLGHTINLYSSSGLKITDVLLA